MMEIVMAIILGSLFGFALYYAGAAKRKNVRAMLRLEDLTLMRIIVYAIGYASVLMGIVAMALRLRLLMPEVLLKVRQS